jgi:hypothetical protein
MQKKIPDILEEMCWIFWNFSLTILLVYLAYAFKILQLVLKYLADIVHFFIIVGLFYTLLKAKGNWRQMLTQELLQATLGVAFSVSGMGITIKFGKFCCNSKLYLFFCCCSDLWECYFQLGQFNVFRKQSKYKRLLWLHELMTMPNNSSLWCVNSSFS